VYPTRSSAPFLVTGDSPDTSSTLLSVSSINSFKLAWLLARLFLRCLCFGFFYQSGDFLSSSTEHEFTIECHSLAGFSNLPSLEKSLASLSSFRTVMRSLSVNPKA
jgi:hypothetical protein